MQAILTKYLSPTDTKGSRVKATCGAGSVTVSWDYGLSIENNHAAAAKELIRQLGWTDEAGYKGDWTGGCLPSGDYAFCLTNCAVQFKV